MDRENLELNGRTFRASGSDDGKGTYDTGEGVCVFNNQPSMENPQSTWYLAANHAPPDMY